MSDQHGFGVRRAIIWLVVVVAIAVVVSLVIGMGLLL